MPDVKIVDSKLLLARDFSSLMEWAVDKIPKITDEWTDFTITSPEMIYMSNLCYMYDILHYVLDRKFLDNLIRYSTSESNLMNMGSLMGQIIPGYNSATVILDVYLSENCEVVLPKGFIFVVEDNVGGSDIYLNTLVEHTLRQGTTRITCVEGIRKTDRFSSDMISSNGEYILQEEKIALNFINIWYEGESLSKVRDSFLETEYMYCFSAYRYSNNHTLLKFVPGSTFKFDGMLDVEYYISSGSKGNLSVNAVVGLLNRVSNLDGKDVSRSISISVVKSYGGSDLSSLDEMRNLIGNTASQIDTLVIEYDYDSVVREVEGVLGCVVQSDREDCNLKRVYFIYEESISGKLNEVRAYIQEVLRLKAPGFTEIVVNPIILRPLSLDVGVYLNRNDLNTEKLEEEIREYIINKFKRGNTAPGEGLNRASLSFEIEYLSYTISHVIINYPGYDIKTLWCEIFDLQNLSISFNWKP